MRHLWYVMALTVLVTMSQGCAVGMGPRALSRFDAGPVQVRVQNRGWSDASIYRVSDGLVQRIGFATGVRTTTLWVSARLLGHSNDIRLISAPIGSKRSRTTEPVLVRPGQMVQLTLENNLGRSSWGVW